MLKEVVYRNKEHSNEILVEYGNGGLIKINCDIKSYYIAFPGIHFLGGNQDSSRHNPT